MLENTEKLEILRHSASHIMAQAVLRLLPGTKLAIGPAIENGFYYDFETPRPLTPEDLPKIENEMKKIISENQQFKEQTKSKNEALADYDQQLDINKYKIELTREIEDEKITFYYNINQHNEQKFVDMCRGPHINFTSELKHFKLLSIAGAYWRGDSKREMLTRIYGTAFFTKEELDNYLNFLEEAKKRDHRKLGKDLDLFSIHEDVGAGLIHWHPKGTVIRNIIEELWKDAHKKMGYLLVSTPHIASEDIYKISGHLQNYSDLMYSSMDIEGKPYRVKPMNCPGHIMIYKTRLRSYRELPIRYAEMGTVYRFEKSGVLHGLLRVRGFTIDDAHIICMPDQLEEEILNVIDFSFKFLNIFGFSDYSIYLSTKPLDKFVGDDEDWIKAENSLRMAMDKLNLKYSVDEGGGAFYGPKIDIKVKDCLSREWQCSTIQFDFNLPQRFDLEFEDKDGKKRPYMVHRALIGSIERFFGVLLEHYSGRFPVWLSPVQVVVISITEEQKEYVGKLKKELLKKNFRVEIDDTSDKLGYKIRKWQMEKVPYIVVAGKEEVSKNMLSVRKADENKDLGVMNLDSFSEILNKEIKENLDSKKFWNF